MSCTTSWHCLTTGSTYSSHSTTRNEHPTSAQIVCQELLCNRLAHEQTCRRRAGEGAKELAGLRQVLYRAIVNSDNNSWILMMARQECPDQKCRRLLHTFPAQSVLVLKCGHSMCKDCVEGQTFSPPGMRSNPMILCKMCSRVCRKAEIVDSLSLNTGRAGIYTIEAPGL